MIAGFASGLTLGVSAAGAAMALVCAVSWGALDASRKVLLGTVTPVALVVLLSLGQLPVFAATIAIAGGPLPTLDPAYVVPAAASLGLNVVANVLFMVAVARSPLSMVIPLLAFVPVLSTLLAQPLLGEMPGGVQLLGIGAVALGALALGADGAKTKSPLAMARAIAAEPGTLPMLGVAVAWALTLVFDKQAVQVVSVAAHALVLNAGMVLVLGVVLVVAGRAGELLAVGKARRAYLGAVVFSALAMGTQLLAVQFLLVGVLEAVKRAVGITMSVVVGRLMFDEPITSAKLVAMALMIAGTAAIVLGPAG